MAIRGRTKRMVQPSAAISDTESPPIEEAPEIVTNEVVTETYDSARTEAADPVESSLATLSPNLS